jgi:hypothetical protein
VMARMGLSLEKWRGRGFEGQDATSSTLTPRRCGFAWRKEVPLAEDVGKRAS